MERSMRAMPVLDALDSLAPISDFSRGKANVIFERSEHNPVFVIKRNKPQYVIMSLDEYRRLQEALEDMADLQLARERMTETNMTHTASLSDVASGLGITREMLDEAPEPEFDDGLER